MLRGDDVAELQRRLNALGFDAGQRGRHLRRRHRRARSVEFQRNIGPRRRRHLRRRRRSRRSTASATLADGLGRQRARARGAAPRSAPTSRGAACSSPPPRASRRWPSAVVRRARPSRRGGRRSTPPAPTSPVLAARGQPLRAPTSSSAFRAPATQPRRAACCYYASGRVPLRGRATRSPTAVAPQLSRRRSAATRCGVRAGLRGAARDPHGRGGLRAGRPRATSTAMRALVLRGADGRRDAVVRGDPRGASSSSAPR